MAHPARAIPALPARALFSGARSTKPESQNTGIETIYPTIAMARGTFLSPVRRNVHSAIRYAPPDLSKKVPMIEPQIITMPIVPIVSPKPLLTELTTSLRGMPARMPNPKAAASNAKNACSFSLTVVKMIKKTDNTSSRKSPVSASFLFRDFPTK
jgi:hypothetical protein